MPKAKGKGGKTRRRGKNEGDENKRELIFKEDGQEYAQVVKMLGNGRIEAKCQDGETRLGQIRGQLRKKVWIVVGDIVLLSLREFQDERADVIHKYTADEARNLKTYGELKSDFQINEAAAGGDEEGSDSDGAIDFEEADIDDICESPRGWQGSQRALTDIRVRVSHAGTFCARQCCLSPHVSSVRTYASCIQRPP